MQLELLPFRGSYAEIRIVARRVFSPELILMRVSR